MKKRVLPYTINLLLSVLAGIVFLFAGILRTVSAASLDRFFVELSMEGGSGRASIESPVEIRETEEGMEATLIWSSEHYDYMLVDGVRYDNENAGGPSTFHVPVRTLQEPLTVIADTLAMGTPHEIEYVITWGERVEEPPAGAAESLKDTADGAEADGTRANHAEADNTGADRAEADDTKETEAALSQTLEQAGYARSGSLPLQYAAGFTVTFYGDYASIRIPGSGVYLLVPEGADIPAELPPAVVLLKKPLSNTCLVSTSAMDLICSCGALPMIRLSGAKESDWYIDEAREAMERGEILYAGKYSAPDYERILSEGCRLVIENTMIYHKPAVLSKLEELGIPVLVETSSYEAHPLGRLEWILLYGLLFDRQGAAREILAEQTERILALSGEQTDTGLKAAFFHVTASGVVNVRKSGDYITSMIRMAGGHYTPENAGEGDNALSSMNMQMEDFYAQARDADILIYNSTIGGEIGSVSELIGKNPLFADFKAVREGRVYCTKRDLFQKISQMADFLADLHDLLRGTDREYTFLNRLE